MEKTFRDKQARMIYESAVKVAKRTADIIVPTPVELSGGYLLEEGVCGFAGVVIKDARSSFARWLRKQEIGRKDNPGWYISADTGSQSLERNKAYAFAFAEVLMVNGINCKVEWSID